MAMAMARMDAGCEAQAFCEVEAGDEAIKAARSEARREAQARESLEQDRRIAAYNTRLCTLKAELAAQGVHVPKGCAAGENSLDQKGFATCSLTLALPTPPSSSLDPLMGSEASEAQRWRAWQLQRESAAMVARRDAQAARAALRRGCFIRWCILIALALFVWRLVS